MHHEFSVESPTDSSCNSSTCLCWGAATEWVGDSNSTERGDLLQGGLSGFRLTYNQDFSKSPGFIWFWYEFVVFLQSESECQKKVKVYPPKNVTVRPYPTFSREVREHHPLKSANFCPSTKIWFRWFCSSWNLGPMKSEENNWHPKLLIHLKKNEWDLSNRFFRGPFSDPVGDFLGGRGLKVGWKFCWQFAAWIDGYPTHQKYL